MNTTDDLIAKLAAEPARPARARALAFGVPLAAAVALGFVLLIFVLGDPFADVTRRGAGPLAAKWAFSGLLMCSCAAALYQLGHPDRRAGWLLAVPVLPFAVFALLAVAELVGVMAPFPGATWATCLMAMAVLSPLGFGAAVLALRSLAPVHQDEAGFVAGLFGGALAATAYAPFCPESGAIYYLVFYGLPMLTMAGLGWLLGPRVLRW